MTKAWDDHEAAIKSLYAQHTLKKVRKIMLDEHGFKASIRAYRQRLDKWGINKYKIKSRKDRARSQESNGSSSINASVGSGACSPDLRRDQPGTWQRSPQTLGVREQYETTWEGQMDRSHGGVVETHHQGLSSESYHNPARTQLPTLQHQYSEQPAELYWTTTGHVNHGGGTTNYAQQDHHHRTASYNDASQSHLVPFSPPGYYHGESQFTTPSHGSPYTSPHQHSWLDSTHLDDEPEQPPHSGGGG